MRSCRNARRIIGMWIGRRLLEHSLPSSICSCLISISGGRSGGCRRDIGRCQRRRHWVYVVSFVYLLPGFDYQPPAIWISLHERHQAHTLTISCLVGYGEVSSQLVCYMVGTGNVSRAHWGGDARVAWGLSKVMSNVIWLLFADMFGVRLSVGNVSEVQFNL
jgi:hypothetical protein